MANPTIYTVGGTVQAGRGIYIKRKVDDELLELCRKGEYAFILSPRQVGKSSLMVGTARQLEKENIHSVIIDLSAIGVEVSQDEWYQGILYEIETALNLKTNAFEWWAHYPQLGPSQRLINFFKDVLLKEIQGRVILFFDEIDTTLNISFADDFYASLRAIHNARSAHSDFRRLSFVLVGVATPTDLIADPDRTPFNVGTRIDLVDFTLDEARPLSEAFGENAEQVLKWIFRFTNGHPYLTQRLCAYLAKSNETLNERDIESAVHSLFIGEKGNQDNNLQFVSDMVAKRSPDVSKVLKIYRDVRIGKKVVDEEHSTTKAHLKLSGLVRSEKGLLRVRNEIYNSVFTPHWVKENTPRNWLKATAVSIVFIAIVFLVIFAYDSSIESKSKQLTGDFYTSDSNSVKLDVLKSLFELDGVLQNTDYDFRARELFYSLNWDEQINLFEDASISLVDRQKYLPVIVNGLYITMANVDSGQDNSDLLKIMKNSLEGLNVPDSINLREEIAFWLEARNAVSDELALEKYDNAVLYNPNNPATRFERAIVELRLGLYEQALLDLDATMLLAPNLSNEASEKKIPTPTSRPTRLVNFQTTTPVPVGIVNTPFVVTAIPTPTIKKDTVVNGNEGYRSSFYSIAYIRSAVALALDDYLGKPNFDKVVIKKLPGLINLKESGLLNSLLDGVDANPTNTELPNVIATPIYTADVSATPLYTPESGYTIVDPQEVLNIAPSVRALGQLAVEKYSTAERNKINNVLTFTINSTPDVPILWRWFWCAVNDRVLEQNMAEISLVFDADGYVIPVEQLAVIIFENADPTYEGWKCRTYETVLRDWKPGTYKLTQTMIISSAINDGSETFEAGYKIYEFTVNISP